jgi:hypothetical protein
MHRLLGVHNSNAPEQSQVIGELQKLSMSGDGTIIDIDHLIQNT